MDALAREAGFVVREGAIVPHVRWENRHVIRMPPRWRWAGTEWRAATLAHELGHACASRMWRQPEEETRAEMFAVVLLELVELEYPEGGEAHLDDLGGWRSDFLPEVLERLEWLLNKARGPGR